MVSFTQKQEQFLQLIAKESPYGEIATHMNISPGAVQGGYLQRMLDKTGFQTEQELVIFAKQKFLGEAIGTDIERLCRTLKGIAMEPVRDFYRRLEQHYLQNDCSGCKSYHKYHVMVIPGNFHNHLELFTTPDKDVRVLLYHLEQHRILHVRCDDDLYRVTFLYLQGEEQAA
jgi:DNA-binding CsgD family transcriptional regulator